MFKISHILTGALAAAALMIADWATAAPLSLSYNAYAYSRSDQMGPVEEQTEQGYETPAQFKRQIVAYTGSETASAGPACRRSPRRPSGRIGRRPPR